MKLPDEKHIWHPYTSSPPPYPSLLVEKAEGVYIHLANGKKLIDAMSSWWAVVHGYNHPVLNTAVQNQLDKMAHIMFGGLTHQPAIDLSRKLVEITPEPLQKVFFSDSGSVAVEVAMKMAIQYSISKGENEKTDFLTIRGGYHGDAWHAMSICDPKTGMHTLFEKHLPKYHFVPRPSCKFDEEWEENDIAELEGKVLELHKTISAIILEPICQGAGGMWFYHPQYLCEVKKICEKYNLLLIADEIATGFGRTGELFACNYANISPDIMCLGKAITGGYMSFAATLCTEEISDSISQNPPYTFMHGPTFMGNPLACAVGNASIDLLLQNDWQKDVKRIEKRLKRGLSPLQESPKVKGVRVLGAIGVVEMNEPVDMETTQKFFVNRGVWIRPFGKLLYLMPPYIISDDELGEIIKTIEKYLDQ